LHSVLNAFRQTYRGLPNNALPTMVRLPVNFALALLLIRFADELFTFIPAGSLTAIRRDVGLTYSGVVSF
jgi:hypothetical protein